LSSFPFGKSHLLRRYIISIFSPLKTKPPAEQFTFVRNPNGVHQYLGVEPGHKTIVRPNTRMGWGDFDNVTPDKIVTTVLRW
jgi:hypothetical protein